MLSEVDRAAEFCVILELIIGHCSGTAEKFAELGISNKENGRRGRFHSRASVRQANTCREHSRRACRWPHVSRDDCQSQASGKVLISYTCQVPFLTLISQRRL